jgi:cytochrome c peroxidase
MPQLGPGKEELENSEHGEDRGVLLITDKNADLYKFKTPTLRNVYHTGPWSHAGAYNNLKDFLLHHTNSKLGMENFLSKPDRFIKGQRYLSLIDFDTERNNARVASTDKKLTKLNLSKRELKDLYEFLKSLSDLSHYNRVKVPSQVPSGLSIAP